MSLCAPLSRVSMGLVSAQFFGSRLNEWLSREDSPMKEIIAALSVISIACLAGSAAVSAPPEWSIAENKSSTDDSPQVSAALVVGDAALVLRCREQKIEAAYSTQNTYLGDDFVTIRFRIDAQEPVKEVWKSSVNSHAAFAPKPEDFIRALPDNGRVFIRALLTGGQTKDTNFILSGVSDIREKIGHACKSPGASGESTGSINPSKPRAE
jgi:hypothetical protein